MSKIKGFTIAEVIVVIAIFCLLFVVIYSIYLLNQRTYIASENTAEIVQNSRVILERMAREIRQAKLIISELPTERINAPDEIKFQDGHNIAVSHQGNAQSGTLTSITMSSLAENTNNYYKDLYIKIISGTGEGQIRKIYQYDGDSKIAVIEGAWDIVPDISSVYIIDSSYYYIHYYKDASGEIFRKLYTYCLSQDGLTCAQPETYIAYNSIAPPDQQIFEVVLEEPRIIGEYASNLEIWGSREINIFLELEKDGKSINLKTTIFGRNL